jgi:hypothetical protein
MPNYVVVEYPEVKLQEGMRIFSMHERDTHLLGGLPIGPYSRFVFFPLALRDAEGRRYLQTIEDQVGRKNLQTVPAGGVEFVTGPIADLPRLFPELAKTDEGGCVSTASLQPPVCKQP